MKHIRRSVYYLIIGLSLVSCKNESPVKETPIALSFTVEGKAELFKYGTDSLFARFDVEFAKSEYETQTGLMYRSSMAPEQGMLFIFFNEQPRYFYMKNTQIALDIIYLSSDKKVVSLVRNAEPFNEETLPSNEPAMYVLELNAGLIDQLGIDIGDRLEYYQNKT